MRSSAAAFAASGPIYLGYRLGHIEGKGAPFRAIVYNKSAIVLHMLRRLIGDVPFARGLRRFYADWTFKKASTDDLRAAFEAESGRPLGRFFDRWILGAALPRLKTSWTMDDGAKTAIVRIEQVGDVFDLPLTVSVQYEDGTAKNVQLAITEAVTDARIPLTGKVRRILTKDELTLAEYVD
jgi:aminopeptidase N